MPNFPQNPIFQFLLCVNLRNLKNRYLSTSAIDILNSLPRNLYIARILAK